MYSGKNFYVTKSFSIVDKGSRCACFYEDEHYCWLWFKNPVIGSTHQLKVRKNLMINLKEC